MTSTITRFEAIVIGSGQAGGPLAIALAKAGHKTALVEKVHIGGCCVNEGCTPTKTMIASGRVAYLAARAPKDYGIHHQSDGDIVVDMLKVRQRKRDIVDQFRRGNESRLKSNGVEVIMGEASFAAGTPLSLVVHLNEGGTHTLQAEKYFINTGERPALPKIHGIASLPNVLDSTSIMELDVVPDHLVVLGGGYIGIEFAQLMRRLGARVTVVQRGSQLLAREDKDIAEEVAKILREDGIDVLLNTTATSVAAHSSDGGSPRFELRVCAADGAERGITGSHLFAAAGRTPNSDMLNLQGIGIRTNARGYIQANDYLETSVPGVWALGDVTGPPAFTHISYDDYRIVAHNVLNPAKTRKTRAGRRNVYTVFMDPQLGHVGLHEHEARALGMTVRVASMRMTSVARALEMNETRGLMKAIVDANDMIVGFTCLGIEGGEVMNIVQVAMMGNLPYSALQDAVWAHPTLGEALNNMWSGLQ